MSRDRSRSPGLAKRFRSRDRASYRDAPYKRDKPAYRYVKICVLWISRRGEPSVDKKWHNPGLRKFASYIIYNTKTCFVVIDSLLN